MEATAAKLTGAKLAASGDVSPNLDHLSDLISGLERAEALLASAKQALGARAPLGGWVGPAADKPGTQELFRVHQAERMDTVLTYCHHCSCCLRWHCAARLPTGRGTCPAQGLVTFLEAMAGGICS